MIMENCPNNISNMTGLLSCVWFPGANCQHHRWHGRPGGRGEVLGHRQGHLHPVDRQPRGDQEEIHRLAREKDTVGFENTYVYVFTHFLLFQHAFTHFPPISAGFYGFSPISGSTKSSRHWSCQTWGSSPLSVLEDLVALSWWAIWKQVLKFSGRCLLSGKFSSR